VYAIPDFVMLDEKSSTLNGIVRSCYDYPRRFETC
jgi:hypothetical protein